MATFSLKQGADTFDFDVFGSVKKGATNVGTWATDASNNIVVKKPDGTTMSFTVDWSFNADNQLVLSAGGQPVFNFNKVAGNRPFYATQNAVIKVRPDKNHTFGFDLRGTWSFDANSHSLTVTIKTVKSTFDGVLLDSRSRFMYHFFTKNNGLKIESIFGFVGKWNPANVNGVPKLSFSYTDINGSPATFQLPNGITIDRSVNQFVYQYDKNNRTFGIQFIGVLEIKDGVQLTYSIDRQVGQNGDQQVAATTFTLNVSINNKSLSGDIEFFVKKTDGSNGTTVVGLSGDFTATLGTTQLQVGFSFTQTRGANTVTTSFGLTGKLTFDQNGEVAWGITTTGGSITISISATDIKLGDARLDARLNLVTADGHIVGIQALFGISF
jgi:hypothetical protein